MTSLVWLNFLLAAAFLLAWVGIPLWLVFKRRETAHDHSQAHAYLAAKEELARSELAGAATPAPVRRHVPTARRTVVGRHHARVRTTLHAPARPRSGSGVPV